MGEKNDREHLVVWLDLLGVADRLEEPGSTVSIGNLLEKEIPAAVLAANQILSSGPDGKTSWVPMVEVEQFQDTIVLWTDGTDPIHLELLLLTAARIVANCHGKALPVRGAVSIGTFYTSRLAKNPARLPDGSPITVVIGSAIARAARLEKTVRFAGVVIDSRLTWENTDDDGNSEFPELANYLGFEDPGLWVEYEGRLFLAWPGEFIDEDDDEILASVWPAPTIFDPAIEAKVTETRKFLTHFRKNGKSRRQWLKDLRKVIAEEEKNKG